MPQSVETRDQVVSLFNRLKPMTAVGRGKVRVGRDHDGGYVMLDAFEGVEAAYSFGIKDDVSWDADIAARNITVFQYDHTIDALPDHHDRFRWYKLGLGPARDPAGPLESLDRLVKLNGHGDSDRLIMKCDIEGAEWAVLASAPSDVLSKFKQIVIEIHDLQNMSDPSFAGVAYRSMFNLTRTHNLVHVHGNNYGPWTLLGGIPLPVTLELSFARKDDHEFTESHETFPGPLDMPNKPGCVDYYLGRFRFD